MELLVKRLPRRMPKVTSHKLNVVTNAAQVKIPAHAHAPEEVVPLVVLLLTVLLKPLEPLLSLPTEESKTSTESLRTLKEKLRPEKTKRELKTPFLNLERRSLLTLKRLKLKMLLMTPRKKLTKSLLPRKPPMMLLPPPKRPVKKPRMLPKKLLKPKKRKRKRRRKKRKSQRKKMIRKTIKKMTKRMTKLKEKNQRKEINQQKVKNQKKEISQPKIRNDRPLSTINKYLSQI